MQKQDQTRQHFVELIRLEDSLIAVDFSTSPRSHYIDDLFVITGALRRHVNSPRGYHWWHAREFGEIALSWRASAQIYAKRHGIAVIVDRRGSISVVLNLHGLSFWRCGGKVVYPLTGTGTLTGC